RAQLRVSADRVADLVLLDLRGRDGADLAVPKLARRTARRHRRPQETAADGERDILLHDRINSGGDLPARAAQPAVRLLGSPPERAAASHRPDERPEAIQRASPA